MITGSQQARDQSAYRAASDQEVRSLDRNDPLERVEAQEPQAGPLDAGQIDALSRLGLVPVLVPADGDGQLNALLRSAPAAFLPGTDAAQVRETIIQLAGLIIDDPDDEAHLELDFAIRVALTERDANTATNQRTPGGRTDDDAYFQQVLTRLTPDGYRDRVLAMLADGDWAGAAGDIPLLLAATAYRLNITIIRTGGAARHLNSGRDHDATLVQVRGHYHATVPRPPHTQPPTQTQRPTQPPTQPPAQPPTQPQPQPLSEHSMHERFQRITDGNRDPEGNHIPSAPNSTHPGLPLASKRPPSQPLPHTPAANLPAANLPAANLPAANLPAANLPAANLPAPATAWAQTAHALATPQVVDAHGDRVEMTQAPVFIRPDLSRRTDFNIDLRVDDRGMILLADTPVLVGTNLAAQWVRAQVTRNADGTAEVAVAGLGVLLDQTQTNTLETIANQAQAQAHAQAQAQAQVQALAQALVQALAQAQVQAQALAQATRPPGHGPGEAAAHQLLQTLSVLEHIGPTATERTLTSNLRAAVLHYARTGNVNAPLAATEPVPDGREVNLGTWLDSLRRGHPIPRRARLILEVLGMTDDPPAR